jgi:V8-like Glu-specific endopeptidase
MIRAARRAALLVVAGAMAAAAAAASIGPAAATAGGPGRTPAVVSGHAAVVSGHAAAVVSGHAAALTRRQQAGVRRYWTRARMEHAVPLSPRPAGRRGAAPARVFLTAPVTVAPRAPARAGLPAADGGGLWTGGGAVARTTGKVFFSLGRSDYVCSASTVASAGADLVVTAAHCVKDGTGAWAANWTFVPGYAGGKAPYGSYTARRFYVASQWSSAADNDYDVAFVTVNPAVVAGSTVAVAREVGGQGIEFGSQPARVMAFGYPADPPYHGGQLAYCSGTTQPDPYGWTSDTGLSCAMTAGSSGGPWLSGFSPAAGTGIIASVSSFKYSNDSQILYGPPLGATAQALYQAAARG